MCVIEKISCLYSFAINPRSKLKKISTIFLRNLPRKTPYETQQGFMVVFKFSRFELDILETFTTATNIFLFFLFVQKNLYFVRKLIWKNLMYTVTFLLQFFRTSTPIQICIDLADDVPRPKIRCNRVGILMQILITMDYYFFF